METMMWIIFIILVASLILSLLWLVWKLRQFSQSQNQTYVDDKLMQALLNDENFSKKIKKAVVKTSGHATSADEDEDGPESPQKNTSDAA